MRKDLQTIVQEYLAGDLDYDEAIEQMLKADPTLTAMECERILDDLGDEDA
ncbi:hypothetical protein PP744_gp023 [Rhizobium phage RHph_N38]|uniref:Uncharacterized protein n=1 Tax=Rhizobium phage RHph_N38 TaxID=2509750 RepID=A0A7S5R823_9CAUD|nr:hypothetical protein PP744_gp023 [Rhizobium phage RHph_N38]QIG70486.1 hypothetical protein EVB89_023 [Rhizobium phage RHph_N38]